MKFSLVICTYMRPQPLLNLLRSVQEQTMYPDEILIIDGSTNKETAILLQENQFMKLRYFIVAPENRGLTRQRNFGIEQVDNLMEVVCFLDDDIILECDYFEQLLNTYTIHPESLGVGGYIKNESQCEFVGYEYTPKIEEYYFDGWKRKESSRFVVRKCLGLDSDCPPGFSSSFSHGRSVSFLPSSGKTYAVEVLMGGASSFRKSVFNSVRFSQYFEGYGLYEDTDFTLRVAKIGKLFVNTAAQLNHFHAPSGRPNQYKYGKMVVRNGWYVWRVKNPKPLLRDQLKWHAITILLIKIRFINAFTTRKRMDSFSEAVGRTVGWWSLWVNKPKIKN